MATRRAPRTGETDEERKDKITRPPEPIYRLVTTCPQEWFIMVVRGEDLHRIIHSVKDWRINSDFEFERGTEQKTVLRHFLGREFVGIPKVQGMFVYKFAWNKFWRKSVKDETTKETLDSPEYQVVAHEQENVYITPFIAQYPLRYAGIEVIAKDKGDKKEDDAKEAFIPVTLTITIRVRMLRPKVALMTNVDWFGQVLTPKIQQAAKEYAGGKDYDWMIRNARREGSREFETFFNEPTVNPRDPLLRRPAFRDQILDEAGVEVIDIGITDIEPNEKFEKALIEQAEKERQAIAKAAEAEGEKQAKILQGQGEESYLESVGRGRAAQIRAEMDAERERLERTTLRIAGGPGRDATTLEKWRLMQGSNLTTYVEGGASANAAILVGPDGRPVR